MHEQLVSDQVRFAESMRRAIEVSRSGGRERGPVMIGELGARLQGEFAKAKTDRQETEQRWLKDLRQFKGIYDPDVMAKLKKRSKAYMRKTRVKVKSVDARMMDLVFPPSLDRNYRIEATPEPDIGELAKTEIAKALQQMLGQDPTPDQAREAEKNYAEAAAKRMESRIDDQLTEAHYRRTARMVIHSGNLYGTGILKGPLVDEKMTVRYVQRDGRWVIDAKTTHTPFLEAVPLWRIYPDMSATEIGDCMFVWEWHSLPKPKMLDLARNPSFDGEAIRRHLDAYPDGRRERRPFESELIALGDRPSTNIETSGTYDIYERWGWLMAKDLAAAGYLDESAQHKPHEMVFCNVWMLPHGEVVKVAPQPIGGMTYPYHFYYFDKDESSIFAEGLAAIMRDDQAMLNASIRALLDNLAITAGPQLEVFVTQMDQRSNLTELFPFKIWPRTSGDPQYPAMRVHNIDSHIGELGETAKIFDNNADEVTAIPRYFYGENPTGGAAGTASGLSMLMSQANVALKDQVVAFDEGITGPFIRGLYAWNMQFSPDARIKGDYNIKPMAAASLVAKEVRGQLLTQFSSTLLEEEKPYIKWDKLVQQKAQAQDLSAIVKDEEEVKAEQSSPQAQQMAAMQQQMQELQLRTMAANVSKLEAQVGELLARMAKLRTDTVGAAMNVGATAAVNPAASAAGDQILASVGYQDAPLPQDQQPAPQPPMAGMV